MSATAVRLNEATRLTVSEVFGPTCQGEGPSLGRRVAFVRVGLCNLDCNFCDTSFTWDWEGKNGTAYDRATELRTMTATEIIDALAEMHVERVVVSGGEPMVQRARLARLLEILSDLWEIEIETNGTLSPGSLSRYVSQWNVSPKLAHSGVAREKAWQPAVLAELAALESPSTTVAFKFVCRQPSDLDEVGELVELAGLDPTLVWIMPEGTSPEAIVAGLSALADPVIERGYNLTTRLHVLAWGNKRGV